MTARRPAAIQPHRGIEPLGRAKTRRHRVDDAPLIFRIRFILEFCHSSSYEALSKASTLLSSTRMDLIKTDGFCMMPWTHLQVRPDGGVYSCCLADMMSPLGNLHGKSLPEIWNSDEMKKLRREMLEGGKPSQCTYCYGLEKDTGGSFRQYANRKFAHHYKPMIEATEPDGSVSKFNVVYIDFRLSNLCNLRCRSCGNYASSSWFKDEKNMRTLPRKLIDTWRGTTPKESVIRAYKEPGQLENILEQVIPNLEEVYFAGGEPLLMEEHYKILDALIGAGRTNITIRYNTNFSKLEFRGREVTNLWKHFSDIAVQASLDGAHERGEYMRKGQVWARTIANREKLARECPHVKFEVSATVSAYNVWHIPDFFREWVDLGYVAEDKFTMNPLYGPDHLRMQVLPADIKMKTIEKYEHYLSTYVKHPKARRSFKKKYAEKVYVSEEANQKWIDTAMVDTGKCINVMIENAWMKKLNDKTFKDKDFVTALTNFHKEFVIEEMNKKFPRATGSLYSDFKTLRLTICGDVAQADLAAIQNAYVEANHRFYASPVLKQITRPSDVSEHWFFMGVGRTADQAALAARYARANGGPGHFSYYWDANVLEGLDKLLKDAKAKHAEVLTAFEWTSIPLEVYTAARKAANAQGMVEVLKLLYPAQAFTVNQAQKILDFAALADEFSPSMLVAKREILTINDAPFGALSIDFIGLGAENLQATANAVLEASSVDQAIQLARKYERDVTLSFVARKQEIVRVVEEFFAGRVSIRFSGDDGVIIPEVEFMLREQIYLLRRLSQLFAKPFMRMAAINGNSISDAGELITHAESIEKKLRAKFNDQLGVAVSNDIQMQVFIPEADPRGRNAYLILNLKRILNKEQKEIIRNSFHAAVKTLEEELRMSGAATTYSAADVYAMTPKQRELPN